jgi:hypothetical protein
MRHKSDQTTLGSINAANQLNPAVERLHVPVLIQAAAVNQASVISTPSGIPRYLRCLPQYWNHDGNALTPKSANAMSGGPHINAISVDQGYNLLIGTTTRRVPIMPFGQK